MQKGCERKGCERDAKRMPKGCQKDANKLLGPCAGMICMVLQCISHGKSDLVPPMASIPVSSAGPLGSYSTGMASSSSMTLSTSEGGSPRGVLGTCSSAAAGGNCCDCLSASGTSRTTACLPSLGLLGDLLAALLTMSLPASVLTN